MNKIKGSYQTDWLVEACNYAVSRGATVWMITQLTKEAQGVRYGWNKGVLREPDQSELQGSALIGSGADGAIAVYQEEQAQGSKLFVCGVKASFDCQIDYLVIIKI